MNDNTLDIDGLSPDNIVLLVDDDEDILHGLKNTLTRAGFRVIMATNGQEALTVFKAKMPSIVVLDLMLPVIDGMDVCKEIRKKSDVPILMLTARDDNIDKILGLEMGADDYVTKPFDSREIVARIKAILRRVNRKTPGTSMSFDGGRLMIHLSSRAIEVEGQPVALTPTEFDLLVYLAQHPTRVFTRQQLLEQVWEYDFPGDLRTVDVHIRRLRQKIEKDPSNPTIITTRYGVGYAFSG
ncbi:MAG: response regulator transcription factor [Thermoanaerobacteraceae bacterium]|nr:response regulator transcription factor [Thermoanaerobacteraceae bacterium]